MLSSSVGGTLGAKLGSALDIAGPRPVLIFASAQAKARSAERPQGWGAAELQRRMGPACALGIGLVSKHGWVRIVWRPGAPAALPAYDDRLAGCTNARKGLTLQATVSPRAVAVNQMPEIPPVR